MQLLGQAYGLSAIRGFGDNCDIRIILQNATKTSPHEAMVIDQQDRNLIPHGNPVSPWELAIEPTFRPPLAA